MKLTSLLCFVVLFSISTNAQQVDTLNLGQQFDEIYRTSSNYLEYKVIKKERYNTLKQSVIDSVVNLKQQLTEFYSRASNLRDSLNSLNSNLKNTEDLYNTLVEKEEHRSFLGIKTSKITFKILLCFTIILFIGLLAYFIYRFKSANLITQKASKKSSELEEEFEKFRHRSLEREQQIRRKLQDEINKNKQQGN